MAAFLARPATAPPSAGSNYEITNTGNTNMKVVVRMRPESEAEIRSNYQGVVKVLDEHVVVFDPTPDIISTFQEPTSNLRRRPILSKKHKDLRFAFDRVFDETASQVDLFENTTKSIIDGVLDGINCSVFAYGATGAGKTYTMLGNLENPGVMFLTMMELYRRINEIRDERTCEVVVSYCEVYNETIRDLLAPSGPLDLREDTKKGVVINKLTRHRPQTANEILSMLEIGNRNRTQHPTDANATSSRSHAVFQVFVHQKARTAGLSTQVMCAKMSLIDLAGSERATVTTNRGVRLREGANINKSLLALGNCINALADNKGKLVHVPYRNSKLTRLLKDSLGGNCRTVMIANISPSGLSYEDTYNTLKYADRAKQIRTKLVRNILTVDFHLTKYRAIVQDLQKEIAELKSKLELKTPKQRAFDPAEASRLQGLLQSVYGERSRLRKHMADLDASERETLLRIYRKERELQRIDALTGNEVKKAKVNSRLETLRHHMIEIQRQKQTVHEYLYSNNESIGRIQAEINTSCNSSSASPALRQLVEAVTEAKKLEAESAHQWKQTKHLLKYIKNQEKDVGRNERILVLSLQLVRRQHAMLRASNALAPSLQETYGTLVRLAEGDKGVAWADQSVASLHDPSMAESQQALYESFLVHASPRGRSVNPCAANSPSIAASLGILTSTTMSSQVTVDSNGTSADTATQDSKPARPLSTKMNVPIAPSPLSHSVQSRWQPKGTPVRIPNKPRKPTPTNDSSSSSGLTYNTRLHNILNTGNKKSSPAVSNLKRSKSDSSSGSSGQRDAQPYTLPRRQPIAKQGRALQQGVSSTMGGSLPHLAQPTQSTGANSVDFAPKLHPGNFSTTPLSQQRSATAFNAFEDNFVSPRVAFNPQMKDSSPLQSHALQPTQAVSFPTALLCKPLRSPAPTFSSSHTSFSNQPQRERSGFVPISHAGANHIGPAVSNPRPVPPHIPPGIGKAKYEDISSSTSRNGRSSHTGHPSVAFTPTSMQGSSAFYPVPQRVSMSPAVHNPAQLNHSHHYDIVPSQGEAVRGMSHDFRRQDSDEQRRRLSAELTANTGFHDPRSRGLVENHHKKQYAVEAMPSPRRCSADASWLTQQNMVEAMPIQQRHSTDASWLTKQHTVEAMPIPQRHSTDASWLTKHSTDASWLTKQHTVEAMPSPRRGSADTSHDDRRQYSSEVVPMCSPSRRVSTDIVYEFRKQQSADQNPVLCSPKRNKSADASYTHRRHRSTEIDPCSPNFNLGRRGSLESELNLTYTIDSDKGSVQSAPGVTTNSKHPVSIFNVASTNPLAPLHMNSPKPLEERHRMAFTGEQKKLPSYLQMTKSASSKRIPRIHDKENQPNGKSVSKSKRKEHVRSMRSASVKASSHTTHFVW